MWVWGVGWVWGVVCAVWGVGYGVWCVGCGYGVWGVGCGYGVWNVGCGVWGVSMWGGCGVVGWGEGEGSPTECSNYLVVQRSLVHELPKNRSHKSQSSALAP